MHPALKYLTVKRAFNLGRLWISFQLSRIIKTPVISGKASSIAFEPTTSCNLRCPECPSGLRAFTRPTGMLSMELFRKVIDEVQDHVFYLTLYFQGEPFLNTDAYEMIRYAHQRRIYTITSTNAHYLNEENCRKLIDSGLDKLIVSIDGASNESYKKYRVGGELEKVKAGVKRLVRLKKELKVSTPFISIQTVVFSTNENELDAIRQLSDVLGADELKFKTAQVYSEDDKNKLLPSNPKLSRYKFVNGAYKLDNEMNDSCWKMWQSCVITWDGKVIPCCFDKDAHHKVGDLKCTSFSEVWKSHAYHTFRSSLFTNRSSIEICRNCSEGSKVFIEQN